MMQIGKHNFKFMYFVE